MKKRTKRENSGPDPLLTMMYNGVSIGRDDKESYLNRNYDISVREYQDMLVSQCFRCLICNKGFDEAKPHIDHNHTTGKVRGILCSNCNTGLGMFRDSTLNLANAIVYLKESE